MLAGVDIGGTFTDLVISDDGLLRIHKLPSTPQNPTIAMLAGLEAITGQGLQRLTRIAHGSTVATNAILERKGAKVALITTQGFRDILFIGRQNRPQLYALAPQLPPPLIPRELCFEVPERLDFTGEVLTSLAMPALDRLLKQIKQHNVDAIAVCLLYSFVNSDHEKMIRERIIRKKLFEPWQVVLSHEVLPEFREYERASTVALEAYVRPVMSHYIANLEAELKQRSPKTGLRIMKSDGGVISAGRIKEQAIQTALSGPAAGVIGAYHIAKLAGYTNIITLDMGGTSTDVSICPGEAVQRPQSEIDGLPLRVRLLDIDTVGAGGGSIARIDAGGALRVGPQSAGADPGPAAYGRGGQQATVSDANVVLGRLDATHFLGGDMTLDLAASERVIEQLAANMSADKITAAYGVIEVANVNIDRALRRVSVAKGHDPRQFTLVAFGGAGGLHACDVAARLQIPRVLIPRYPGVLCAFGLLVADVMLDYSQSMLQVVDTHTHDQVVANLDIMLEQAQDALDTEGVQRSDHAFYASLDIRYQGQAYELNMPFMLTTNILDDFHALHHQTYGHAIKSRPVEIVNLRLNAVGNVEHPILDVEAIREHPAEAIGGKPINGGVIYQLYERERLEPGAYFAGPALVFQMDSTCYVPDHWQAQVDGYRNLIVENNHAGS